MDSEAFQIAYIYGHYSITITYHKDPDTHSKHKILIGLCIRFENGCIVRDNPGGPLFHEDDGDGSSQKELVSFLWKLKEIYT